MSYLSREERTRAAAGENDELPPPPPSSAHSDTDPEERFSPGGSPADGTEKRRHAPQSDATPAPAIEE